MLVSIGQTVIIRGQIWCMERNCGNFRQLAAASLRRYFVRLNCRTSKL